jgi:hypothetical protein
MMSTKPNGTLSATDRDRIVKVVGAYIAGTEKIAEVADLLIEICGPPGQDGVNNKSEQKLRKIADLLARTYGDRAHSFNVDHLRALRRAAANFPPGERSPGKEWAGLSFSFLMIAGSPEVLRDARDAAARDNEPFTTGFLRRYKKWSRRATLKEEELRKAEQLRHYHALLRQLVTDRGRYQKWAERDAVWAELHKPRLSSAIEVLIHTLTALKRRLNQTREAAAA